MIETSIGQCCIVIMLIFNIVNFILGNALVDLLQMPGEEAPKAGSRVLCRHPFQVTKYMELKTDKIVKFTVHN